MFGQDGWTIALLLFENKNGEKTWPIHVHVSVQNWPCTWSLMHNTCTDHTIDTVILVGVQGLI